MGWHLPRLTVLHLNDLFQEEVLLHVILQRFFPLPEDFLTVKDYVPVDTDSVIHKL